MEKNHKKNKSIIIILLVIFLGGCFDLQENPISIVTPDLYFEKLSDVETALMGAYSYFYGDAGYGRQFTTALALLDDICDIIDIGTNVERRNMNHFKTDPACPMIWSFWPQLYKVVNAANTAISGLEKITITDQKKANELEAEGRMLRTLVHFDFVRLFGDIPYMDFAVTDPKAVVDMSRTPVSEIYPKLIEDCLYGIQNLPDKRPNDIRCRPTKGSAKTMLAYIYLTLGDYANAAKYAVEVINERANYGYELMPDYTNLWAGRAMTQDVAEYIWTIDFREVTNDELWAPMTGVRNGAAGRTELGGWSVVGPARGYLEMFDPGDHRIESTFILEAKINTKTTPSTIVLAPYTDFWYTCDIARPHFGKYRKYAGGSDGEGRASGRNFNIYRLAEVYLMAAEALAEVSWPANETQALGYLNKIRERARNGNPAAAPADYPTGMSKTAFINAVLKERMLEFGGEWKRWWDIQRRKLGAEAFGQNTIEYFKTIPNASAPNDWVKTFPHDPSMWGVKNYLLPIPQEERSRATNMTQNPGYRD